MPEADCDPEMVFHSLAEDHAIRLIDLEGERVGRFEPAKGDRPGYLGEEVIAHVEPHELDGRWASLSRSRHAQPMGRRRLEVMTPVSKPPRWRPPAKRACSIFRHRSWTTFSPASTAIRAASS